MNWFQRHLNWTWVFAWLIWIPLNASHNIAPQIIGSIFLLVVSGWVIKQKGRSLWWVLLTIVFSPLWLGNKKNEIDLSQKEVKLSMFQKSRTRAGLVLQILGYLIWLGCGIYIFIYSIIVIYDAFGFWLATLSFILFPIVYAFAFFIDWIITGIFPLTIFILWIISLVGMGIIALGSSIKGE